MASTDTRTVLAFVFLSVWLGLLLFGWIFGGAAHALLLGALVLFPWSRIRG